MNKLIFYILFAASIVACGKVKNTTSTAISEKSDAPDISPFDEKLFAAITENSLGNHDKAYNLFQQCAELDNSQTVPYYEMARLDIKKNNIAMAIQNAQKAVDQDENNVWYQIVLADAFEKRAEYKKAILHYKKAVSLMPTIQEYYIKVIDNYKKMLDKDGAVEYINVMEEKFGISEELSFQKYDILLGQGKKQEAVNELQQLILYYPEEVRYRGMLAEYYASEGKLELALAEYEKMRQMDPENGLLHWQLAHHYNSIGQSKEAFDEFILAFESTEIDVEQKIEVTQSYIDSGKYQEAETLIETLKATYPSSNYVYRLSAELLMSTNRFEEALPAFRKALTAYKSDQDLWIQTLKLAYTLGEGKMLAQDGAEAVSLFPSQPICYLYKAIGTSLTGDYKTAKTTLMIGKEFIIDNPNLEALFLAELGHVAYRQGDNRQAMEHYNNALTKAPQDPQVKGSYFLYLLAIDKMDQVASQFVVAEEPIYQHVQAQLLNQQNKLAESKAIYEGMLDNNAGKTALLLEDYGDLLVKIGEPNKALTVYQMVMDKTGNLRVKNKIDNLN